MQFFDRLLEKLRATPGVRSAGTATTLPVTGTGSAIHFNIQGRAQKTPHDYVIIGYRPVTSGYLETLGRSSVAASSRPLTPKTRHT